MFTTYFDANGVTPPSTDAYYLASGFALVIGVDRGAGTQNLLDEGADVVVHDLAELVQP